MELLMASGIGVMMAGGIYLVLRPRSFDVVLGLTLISYAVNLFIFSMGRLTVGGAPIVTEGSADKLATLADPLPQALVLTAIVIAFAMTAVSIVLAMRSRSDNHSDHVDAHEDEAAELADTAPGREGGP
jgi:multicomponent K+:H+ antiporter subunit C